MYKYGMTLISRLIDNRRDLGHSHDDKLGMGERVLWGLGGSGSSISDYFIYELLAVLMTARDGERCSLLTGCRV